MDPGWPDRDAERGWPGRAARKVAAVALGSAVLVLSAASIAGAQEDGFDCLPAPEGWELNPTPGPGTTGPESSVSTGTFRFICFYGEFEAEEGTQGNYAAAGVEWAGTETPGTCPYLFGPLLFIEADDVSGDLSGETGYALAQFVYEAEDNPFGGGMEGLARDLLAAAEARAAPVEAFESCGAAPGTAQTPGGEESGGVDPEVVAIGVGVALTGVGGGTWLVRRRRMRRTASTSGGPQLLRRGPSGAEQRQTQTDDTRPKAAPVVTITSPAQGDEVGEYVTVQGTVTDAASVTVIAPGGGGAGSAIGGAFSVITRVGLKRAAIVVEAYNSAGTGRGAVHVHRPGAPDRLSEKEEDEQSRRMEEAARAQSEAQVSEEPQLAAPPAEPAPPAERPPTAGDALAAEEFARDMFLGDAPFEVSEYMPGDEPYVPAEQIVPDKVPPPVGPAHAPATYEQLLGDLARPNGGQVTVPAENLPGLLPPDKQAWSSMIQVAVSDGKMTVNTLLGKVGGRLTVDAGGRLRVELTDAPRIPRDPAGLDFDPMGLDELEEKAQEFLRPVNEAIPEGLKVTDVSISNDGIRIVTGP